MKRLFLLLSLFSMSSLHAETLEADLLIVGGDEAGCAAAVQAARLGVKRIVLVNDIGVNQSPELSISQATPT